MKKSYCLILAFFLIGAAHVSAQETRFGVRIGTGITSFSGSDVPSFAKSHIGLHFGAYANIALNEVLSIEPGLRYATKGFRMEVSDEFKPAFRNTYIDIPLLLRIQAAPAINFFAGLQPSVLLNSSIIAKEGGSRVSFGDSSYQDVYRSFDLAPVLGIGFNLPEGFNAQLSFEQGIIKVDKESEAATFNRSFLLSLGKTF